MAACGTVLWVLVSAAVWCADADNGTTGWEAYAIVSERNIFSRTRRPRSTAGIESVKQTPTVTRTEQSYLVLRGVVREKGVFISFIEDSRTGEVKRVREGEVVGGGTLAAATLDYISYRLGDADTRVDIGRTLEGEVPEASSPQYNSGGGFYSDPSSFDSQKTTSTADQTVVSEGEAKDILQRLKERRKKELGE